MRQGKKFKFCFYLRKFGQGMLDICWDISGCKILGGHLSEVRIAEGESIESALKRFKKKIQKAGILSEIKRRERYEKPSVKRKRKAEAARKRRT
jgi:small subunit ribosomal protein S21